MNKNLQIVSMKLKKNIKIIHKRIDIRRRNIASTTLKTATLITTKCTIIFTVTLTVILKMA